MAKKTAKPEETPDDKKGPTTSDIMKLFLKANKDDHFNFEESYDYKVSTGSFIFDYALGGGFGPGVNRFVGLSESGKTSASLEVARNFFKTVPNSRGVYIKAEGRLDEKVQTRSGLKFVFTPEEWVDGTMFVLETNIYEVAASCIDKLIHHNPEKKKYIFIVDSVDGLLMKGDKDKPYGDSSKVAGGAVMASNLMKRVSIPLAKRGHMALFLSQVRSQLELNPYAGKPAKLLTISTGGNALIHFANVIVEFMGRFGKDEIGLSLKETDKISKENPRVGHNATVIFRKSINENTGNSFKYPIKHGREGGKSIWIEKEIADLLKEWQELTSKGAWYNFSDEIKELLLSNGFEAPQFQGMAAVLDYLEANEALIPILKDFLLSLIEGGKIVKKKGKPEES